MGPLSFAIRAFLHFTAAQSVFPAECSKWLARTVWAPIISQWNGVLLDVWSCSSVQADAFRKLSVEFHALRILGSTLPECASVPVFSGAVHRHAAAPSKPASRHSVKDLFNE